MCSGLVTAMTVRVRVIWVLRMLSWDGPVQMARYALVRGVPLFCFFLRTPFLLLPDFLGWFLFPFFFFFTGRRFTMGACWRGLLFQAGRFPFAVMVVFLCS